MENKGVRAQECLMAREGSLLGLDDVGVFEKFLIDDIVDYIVKDRYAANRYAANKNDRNGNPLLYCHPDII